jgi:hypothetical protein
LARKHSGPSFVRPQESRWRLWSAYLQMGMALMATTILRMRNT